MNLFDLVVIVLAACAATGGYRLGFIARGVSWIGLALGAVLGYNLVPRLTERLEGASQASLAMLIIATLLGCALIGQGLGLTLGSKMHISLPQGPLRRADRVAGSALGAFGVIVLLWVLLPSLATVRGWTSREVRSSVIAGEVDSLFPDPPSAMQALRRTLAEDELFQSVFDELLPAPDLGPAPAEAGLSQATFDTVAASTVKIRGEACDRIQEGSGFVVAEDLVVTNAHVVAGENDTEIIRNDGGVEGAVVVAYDPVRDLAVLRVNNLGLPPLELRDADLGDIGGVFGHPGGGPLEVSPFKVGEEIRASGKDIYDRQDSLRDVLVLAAELRPGDSGAALVDSNGSVIGVAFAVAPDKDDVAYALALDELRAVLNGDLGSEDDTGDCLV